ncbi:MAG TPA: ABC transporter permease subunit [Anaerolineae bacterium]|nr:ABC transporter permease subunit [Anaerolineae bacterium]
MIAEFVHTLRRLRGQIIGWSIGVALYGLFMALLFDSITQIEGFEQLLASYPEEIMGFFGDIMSIMTPKGYLDVYYFAYMHVIVGILAISAAAGLIIGDEEKGTLDLVLAHPISRSRLFWGRVLGYVAALVIILLAGWLSWVIPAQGTTLDLTWLEFLRPFGPLLATLLLFGSLALVLSMVMPSARLAGMLAGGLLVGNYLLVGLSNLNENLANIVEYTPLYYYQGGDAVTGLNWGWLGGLIGVTLVLALIAWWRFQERDIRVGGEGGWKLPASLQRLARRRQSAGQQA